MNRKPEAALKKLSVIKKYKNINRINVKLAMQEKSLEDRRAGAEVWLIVLIVISVITLIAIYMFMGLGWFTVAGFILAVIFSVIVIPFRERKKNG